MKTEKPLRARFAGFRMTRPTLPHDSGHTRARARPNSLFCSSSASFRIPRRGPFRMRFAASADGNVRREHRDRRLRQSEHRRGHDGPLRGASPHRERLRPDRGLRRPDGGLRREARAHDSVPPAGSDLQHRVAAKPDKARHPRRHARGHDRLRPGDNAPLREPERGRQHRLDDADLPRQHAVQRPRPVRQPRLAVRGDRLLPCAGYAGAELHRGGSRRVLSRRRAGGTRSSISSSPRPTRSA